MNTLVPTSTSEPLNRQLQLEVGQQAPAERLSVWKTLLHDNFMQVECTADAEDLRGTISGRAVDGGSVSRSSLSRQVLSRTPDLIRRDDEEGAIVALVTDGTFGLEQGRLRSELSSGDLCIIDTARPFKAAIASDAAGHGILHVPKSALAGRLGTMDDAAFDTFRATAPLQRLVSRFLENLTDSLDALDAVTLNTLLDQSLDLLALMIGESRRNAIEPSTHRAATLLRIKTLVKAHLCDADLTIEKAASVLGISTRYINTLLATEHTSFGRYVLSERLEGARREIMDPRRCNRQVAEVAFGWGFNNPSSFTRVFKERFGVTPRDAKMAGALP